MSVRSADNCQTIHVLSTSWQYQIVSGKACNFIKNEALAQVFSCEFCEISKNTFFIEHLWWLLLQYVHCK